MTKDLLYFGHDYGSKAPANARLQSDFISEIKERYPSVRLEDCFDTVDGYRQGIEIDGVAQDDYFAWAIARGWDTCSFRLSLIRGQNHKNFDRLIALAKTKHPEAFAD